MRSGVWLLALCMAGCSFDWHPGGTGVGNPGDTQPQLSRVAGLTIDSAEVQVDSLVAETCSGARVVTTVGTVVDLLAAEPIPLAGGELCAAELVFTPPLRVRGTDVKGAAVEADIPLGTIRLTRSSAYRVDGQDLVLEIGQGDWLDPAAVDADAAAGALELASALFEDLDADGVLDASERSQGPVAAGPDRDEEDDDVNDTGADDDAS